MVAVLSGLGQSWLIDCTVLFVGFFFNVLIDSNYSDVEATPVLGSRSLYFGSCCNP